MFSTDYMNKLIDDRISNNGAARMLSKSSFLLVYMTCNDHV